MPRLPPQYVWPASAITDDDMALLYRARENLSPRIPINRLIAEAVRLQYGSQAKPPHKDKSFNRKEVA